MTPEENAQLEKWQTTDGGKAELSIHTLGIVADDLTDALKTRDGARAVRANWHHFLEAKQKLDDLVFEVDNTWRQAV